MSVFVHCCYCCCSCCLFIVVVVDAVVAISGFCCSVFVFVCLWLLVAVAAGVLHCSWFVHCFWFVYLLANGISSNRTAHGKQQMNNNNNNDNNNEQRTTNNNGNDNEQTLTPSRCPALGSIIFTHHALITIIIHVPVAMHEGARQKIQAPWTCWWPESDPLEQYNESVSIDRLHGFRQIFWLTKSTKF